MGPLEAKITAKGQITIPKRLREAYHLMEGEMVVLMPTEEGIMMRHTENSMRRLRGLMRREIDLKKASRFISKIREEWRLE